MRPAYLGGQGFARWQVEEERGRGAGSARESQSLESSASGIKSRWDGHRGKCGVDPRGRSHPGAPFTQPAGQARSCHLRIGNCTPRRRYGHLGSTRKPSRMRHHDLAGLDLSARCSCNRVAGGNARIMGISCSACWRTSYSVISVVGGEGGGETPSASYR